jgi:hypothetical protein
LVRAVLGDSIGLAAENLALRQRLAVLRQGVKRPRLRRRDRVFSAWLCRLREDWRSSLVIVPARDRGAHCVTSRRFRPRMSSTAPHLASTRQVDSAPSWADGRGEHRPLS